MNRPRHLGNPEYRRNPVLGLLQIALCEKNENKQKEWAVVVAQLVEWRFQYHGSVVQIQSPANFYIEHFFHRYRIDQILS